MSDAFYGTTPTAKGPPLFPPIENTGETAR